MLTVLSEPVEVRIYKNDELEPYAHRKWRALPGVGDEIMLKTDRFERAAFTVVRRVFGVEWSVGDPQIVDIWVED